MASKKQEIRNKLKKERAKEIEALGLNPNAEIVDLNDNADEDFVIETFDDVRKSKAPVIAFSTTPQKQKKGFFGTIKSAFSEDTKRTKMKFTGIAIAKTGIGAHSCGIPI